MFHKDTLRLIGRTFNRFFSLLMIVLIGVAFMMGLFATSPILRLSMDDYDDQYHLQDLQLYSSYGFSEEDVEALKTQDYITTLFASKSVDVYSRNKYGDVMLMRMEETNRDINQFELTEGRLPEKENEMVLLSANISTARYAIGDPITVYRENEELDDWLSCTEFTIVGMAQSPAYSSKALGPGNLDNLDLQIVAYVKNDVLISEYYTTIYLLLDGCQKELSYTEAYDKAVENHTDDLQAFALRQQDMLKDELIAKAEDEIEENEAKLEEERAKAQKELDDAKEKLDAANIKLIYAEVELDSGRIKLEAGESELEAAEKTVARNEAQLNDAIKEVEDADPEHRDFDTIYEELSTAYQSYQALKRMKADGMEDTGSFLIEELQATNVQLRNQKQEKLDQKAQNAATISEDRNQILAKQTRINEINGLLEDPNLSAQEKADLETEKLTLQSEIATLNLEISELESEQSQLDQDISDLNSSIQGNEMLIERLQTQDPAIYEDSIDAAMARIDEAAGGDVEKTYADLTVLKNAIDTLNNAKAEIEKNKKELESGRKQLEEAQRSIDKGRKEYEEGLKEYQDGLNEFNDRMEEAEAKLRLARQDLAELPDAKWMILKRDSHYSSYMYDSTCKQMGAICLVMPFLFYLVAALVCMTTMTRLIDEQRGQIGIFRALGFSKTQIITKYASYSLIACLLGSVIGIFAGMAIFPTVIYNTWRLMYILPPMRIVFPPHIIAICVLSFSLLLVVVSAVVVLRTLKDMPSQLMRPKAPKSAKKVFLEKIPFVWKRLSFTGKITARNLIRYKTRFFMTVIGVAGCCSLLVLGWGIKDSISDVIDIQFGEIFHYDYSVNLENDHETEDIQKELEKNLAFKDIVGIMSYAGRIYDGKKDPTITVYVVNARQSQHILNLRNAKGKQDISLSNGGVIISEKFARNNHIEAGDTIVLESAKGIKASVKVQAICEFYFQHYCFISDDYYRTVFAENVHNTSLAVVSDDKDGLKDICSRYESFVSLTDFSSMINSFQTMIDALDYIILVIIVTAGSLAFVVLVNLTQVNISERIREIATLKVLGFHDNEVNSYLFKEIFLLTLIGGLAGMPLGILEHHFVMNVINMDMVMFGNIIRLRSFLYAYLITIVFSLIVLFFTRGPLKKIEMIESLKSVE